jgi:hypothetical protein
VSPQRIQRRRTKGWRMPEGAVYVGRGSRWGNPYRVGEVTRLTGPGAPCKANAADVVRMYRHLLEGAHMGDSFWKPIRGRDLACWCPLVDGQGNPVPCHADVLLDLANREEAP